MLILTNFLSKVDNCMDVLSVIVSAIGISLIFNIIFKKFNIPQVIGYILTGTTIVYLFDLRGGNFVELNHIAEFGIVFLMFTIGLELSIDKMKAMKREVLIFGGFQVLVSGILFFILTTLLFSIETKEAIVISFALAMSSTAIVLKVLNDTKDIQKPYGINSLGVLIFQDMAVVPILLLVTLLSNQDSSLGSLLFQTLISAIVVFFIIFIAGKYAISYFLKFAAETKLDEIFVGAILFIVIGSAVLAHYFGFSYSLGAFLAGMVISETKYKHQTQADLEHFRDILLGVFFVSVGMQIDIAFAINNIFSIVSLLIGILAVKAIIIFYIVKRYTNNQVAFKTSIALCQVGEFSFAVFELSRVNQILDSELHQMLVLIVVFSMIVTPFILKNIEKLTELLFKEKLFESSLINTDELSNHVIICGYGSVGKRVTTQFKNIGAEYIIIERDLKEVESGRNYGDTIIFGDASKKVILEKCHIERAVSVIVAVNDIESSILICESVLKLTKDVKLIARVATFEDKKELEDIDGVEVIYDKDEIAKLLVDLSLICKI
jgi:CPA2 family monovalent cation:H+ antiporter-2